MKHVVLLVLIYALAVFCEDERIFPSLNIQHRNLQSSPFDRASVREVDENLLCPWGEEEGWSYDDVQFFIDPHSFPAIVAFTDNFSVRKTWLSAYNASDYKFTIDGEVKTTVSYFHSQRKLVIHSDFPDDYRGDTRLFIPMPYPISEHLELYKENIVYQYNSGGGLERIDSWIGDLEEYVWAEFSSSWSDWSAVYGASDMLLLRDTMMHSVFYGSDATATYVRNRMSNGHWSFVDSTLYSLDDSGCVSGKSCFSQMGDTLMSSRYTRTYDPDYADFAFQVESLFVFRGGPEELVYVSSITNDKEGYRSSWEYEDHIPEPDLPDDSLPFILGSIETRNETGSVESSLFYMKDPESGEIDTIQQSGSGLNGDKHLSYIKYTYSFQSDTVRVFDYIDNFPTMFVDSIKSGGTVGETNETYLSFSQIGSPVLPQAQNTTLGLSIIQKANTTLLRLPEANSAPLAFISPRGEVLLEVSPHHTTGGLSEYRLQCGDLAQGVYLVKIGHISRRLFIR